MARRWWATLVVPELALPSNLGTHFPSSSAEVVDLSNETVHVGRIHQATASVMNP